MSLLCKAGAVPVVVRWGADLEKETEVVAVPGNGTAISVAGSEAAKGNPFRLSMRGEVESRGWHVGSRTDAWVPIGDVRSTNTAKQHGQLWH